MNFLVQRGKVRSQVIKVPEGLPELLSDVTREVLRCQPTTECLCQFMIDYLHSVIVTRDKARLAKSIIDRALNTVDEIIADLCICDITKDKANFMAVALEECFRRFLERRRCEDRKEKEIVKFQDWDMLDEIIRKCKFTEQELKITRPLIEDAYNRFVEAYMSAAEGTEGTEALYQYFKLREERYIEMEIRNSAAVKIQSNFRGFRVRRSMFLKKVTETVPIMTFTQEEFDEMNEAAIKIQRFFRKAFLKGYIIMEPGDSCDPVSQVSMQLKKPDAYMEKPSEAAVDPLPSPEITTEEPAAVPEPADVPPPPESEKAPEESPPPPQPTAAETVTAPEPPAAAPEEPSADDEAPVEEPPAEAVPPADD